MSTTKNSKDDTEDAFQCSICQKTFKQLNNLESDINNHFSGEKPYKCYICIELQFWDIVELLKHIKAEHPQNNVIFSCRYCKHQFQNESEFILHNEQHLISKTFDCSTCGQDFETAAELNVHKKQHNDTEKKYKCTECNEKFNRSEDLNAHRRVHKGFSMFECQFCKKLFAQSTNLSNHIERVHSEHFQSNELHLISAIVERQHLNSNCAKEQTGKIIRIDIFDLIKKASHDTINKSDQNPAQPQKVISVSPVSELKLITANGTIYVNLIRKFSCSMCPLAFVKSKTLEIHYKRNHAEFCNDELLKKIQECSLENDSVSNGENKRENSEKCSVCDVNFNDLPLLVDHVKTKHNGNKPYKCYTCKLMFSRSTTLLEHQSNHIRTRYQCKYCHLTFVQHQSLAKHLKRHEGSDLHKCSVCDIPFREEKYLIKHMRTHADGKPHKCAFCDKRFAQSCDKVKHQRIHTGERPYKCDVCGKTFAHLTSIKKHKMVHSGERQYQCTFCGKAFQHRSNLLVHTRTHTGERPYKCTICTKSFYTSGHYSDHMKIHNGIKNYKCETCGKDFLHQSSFQKHKNMHAGKKPHYCSICDRFFSQPGHFREHMRIHTGEKPYKCDICSKAFKRSDALHTHMKTHSTGAGSAKNKRNAKVATNEPCDNEEQNLDCKAVENETTTLQAMAIPIIDQEPVANKNKTENCIKNTELVTNVQSNPDEIINTLIAIHFSS